MFHLPRRINGTAFRVVRELMNYDDDFVHGSSSNYSYCYNRDIVNLMIGCDSSINSMASVDVSSARVFA